MRAHECRHDAKKHCDASIATIKSAPTNMCDSSVCSQHTTTQYARQLIDVIRVIRVGDTADTHNTSPTDRKVSSACKCHSSIESSLNDKINLHMRKTGIIDRTHTWLATS